MQKDKMAESNEKNSERNVQCRWSLRGVWRCMSQGGICSSIRSVSRVSSARHYNARGARERSELTLGEVAVDSGLQGNSCNRNRKSNVDDAHQGIGDASRFMWSESH